MKNFKMITIDNPTGTFVNCKVSVKNLNDGRIKVTTEYKNGFKPFEEIMSIENSVFPAWYEANKHNLVISQ